MSKRINNEKRYGQYFTPEIIADIMCSLSNKNKDVNVLEPCAGEGVFLRSLHKNGYQNIDAYEIDSSIENNSPI